MSGFTITDHKGFRMQFANGWAVSVQWGPANSCERNNPRTPIDAPRRAPFWNSDTAECAVFNPSGRMVRITEDAMDPVKGHMTADQVAKLIHEVATGTMWFMVPDAPLTGEELADIDTQGGAA